MKTDTRKIQAAAGIIFLLVLLMNGLYYMMPFDVINLYEYLSGSELQSFQILDIFIGGAVIPLIALFTGWTLDRYRSYGTAHLAKVLVFILVIGILQSAFIFAYDFLPGLALMALAALLFLRAGWIISLISAAVLYSFHMIVNVLLTVIEDSGSPSDIVYTAIQEVNEYSSVFGSIDYFAIIALNIEISSQNMISGIYALLFTVLPWILLGIALSKINVMDFLKTSPVLSVLLFVTLAGGGFAVKMMQILTLGSYSGTMLAENFGGPVLALGYFILLNYAVSMLPGRVTAVFEPLGHYGMTLYILSNVIGLFLYYGIGFGLYGEISIGTMVFIAVLMYAALLLLGMLMKKFSVTGIEQLFMRNSEND